MVRAGVRLLVLGAVLLQASGVAAKKPAKSPKQQQLSLEELELIEGVEVERMVVEALKSETSVQEAPAILTVLPGQQIREQGYRVLADAIGAVPGFISYRWMWGSAYTVNARGLLGSGLLMMDGLDVFDSIQGMAPLGTNIPIEMVQRVELMSGPGGVLWGANSLLGVMNVVTRTADDLEGVEASAGWGTGPGRPNAFRGYVMGGVKLWRERIKLLLHASYDTFYGAESEFPFNGSVARYSSPYPQGPILMSGPMESATPRSHAVTLSGNATLGPVSLYWHVPLQPRMYHPANFTGAPMRAELGEYGLDCDDPANATACAKRVDPDRVGNRFQGVYIFRHAFLRLKQQLLGERLHLDARLFYVQYNVAFNRYVSLIPSSVFPSGVVVGQNFGSHRGGGSLDVQAELPWKLRLLAGGELFYDYLPESHTNFFTDKAVIDARLPYVCPPDAGGKRCPLVVMYQSDRLTGGAFLDLQRRLLPSLSAEVGGRVQASGGKRALDPVFLASGGLVWSFARHWNFKVNYTEGYRPPPLLRTDGNGESINFAGNPDLQVESSRALQGEVNAVLLKGVGRIRAISMRADYSYSWIDNLIQVINGTYRNVSELGIHSAELLAEVALKNGHWFALGYTFIDAADSDRGKVRTIPNQWLVARAFINLWDRRLYLYSNLQVRASLEDPNKYPATPSGPAYLGDVDENGDPVQSPTWTARAVDIVLDRVPPMALWNAGLRFHVRQPQLEFGADFFNILDARLYDTETGFDPTAYLDFTPVPLERFSFFLSATYRY